MDDGGKSIRKLRRILNLRDQCIKVNRGRRILRRTDFPQIRIGIERRFKFLRVNLPIFIEDVRVHFGRLI